MGIKISWWSHQCVQWPSQAPLAGGNKPNLPSPPPLPSWAMPAWIHHYGCTPPCPACDRWGAGPLSLTSPALQLAICPAARIAPNSTSIKKLLAIKMHSRYHFDFIAKNNFKKMVDVAMANSLGVLLHSSGTPLILFTLRTYLL